jgi:hypothetical protein
VPSSNDLRQILPDGIFYSNKFLLHVYLMLMFLWKSVNLDYKNEVSTENLDGRRGINDNNRKIKSE